METREKQAYLIEAHKCDEMLLTLLRMLDVPWNDIFIHMDSKNTDYQPETVECRMKYAKVFHAKRHSVVWGGVSQVKAELVLLKTAVAHGPYQHYHLISGADQERGRRCLQPDLRDLQGLQDHRLPLRSVPA